MSSLDTIETKEQAFNFLDRYAYNRSEEISSFRIKDDAGLIKSFMLETETEYTQDINLLQNVLQDDNWTITPIENDFARVDIAGLEFGFVEIMSSRHFVVHSILKSKISEKHINNKVRSNSLIDFVWLSGIFLNQVWEGVIKGQYEDRFVKFKFNHIDKFDYGYWDDTNTIDDNLSENDDETKRLEEGKGSSFEIGTYVFKIQQKLQQLQDIFPDFYSMMMLRIPDEERGGNDFWSGGKVTNRSQNFRGLRSQISWVLDVYQKVTEYIEKKVWFGANVNDENNVQRISLTGFPIVFKFDTALELPVFQNFVSQVFENSNKDFGLWGNPIQVSNSRFHVYGLDSHLWQKIYLDLSLEKFILILPQGTCGNTVHRFLSNIQRFLHPKLAVYVGDELYDKIIINALLGKI